MERNASINYTDDGYRAFMCPTCKNLRYIKFSSCVTLDYSDDDIVPNVELTINCPYCGEEFDSYLNEGLDPLIASIVKDLESKAYKVSHAKADDESTTIICFCEKLPKEATDLLHSDWNVKNGESVTTIYYCSSNLDERIESLAAWVDKLPERWHICPPKKFKSLM